MNEKDNALIIMVCLIFTALRAQFDTTSPIWLKTIFMMSIMLACLYFTRIAFPKKKREIVN